VERPGGGRVADKRDPAPADVVTVRGVGGKIVPLHRLAAQAWQALVAEARGAGISGQLLLPVSGYRSSKRQKQLFAAAVARYGSPAAARKWVAPPGSSAHQSGRAVDFYLGGRNSSGNVAALRRTPAYKWLAANAVRFGFYPYDAEPWHWEYNPPATP
jgi:LAS superfamily LD-carboxypeptidase LdcB